MADESEESLFSEDDALEYELNQVYETVATTYAMDEAMLMNALYYLWILWADFTVYINQPTFVKSAEPKFIMPTVDEKSGAVEPVYRIVDWGDRFTTSRGDDIGKGQRSTGKLFTTIEKMIGLMLDRIKGHDDWLGVETEEEGDEEGGTTGTGTAGPEARIAFAGHELCQRKAFESVINLKENVVVTNFDPGEWGQRHLKNIKVLAEMGYGLPPQSPRATWNR